MKIVNKYRKLSSILLLVFLIAVFLWFRFGDKLGAEITTFEACAAAGNPVGESYPRQCWTQDGKHFVEDISKQPLPSPDGPITVVGEISCLPKIGDGPQTMECAIGLLADDGVYYGLKFPEGINDDYRYSQGGLRLEISGELVRDEPKGPDGNRYATIGTIEVESVNIIGERQE